MKKKLHLHYVLVCAIIWIGLSFEQGFSQTNLVQNPTADFWTFNTGENADAFDMTPNATLFDNAEVEITSPYRFDAEDNPNGWRNTDLEGYISTNYGGNEQPATTGDGTYDENGIKTRGLKLSSSDRRVYQLVKVTQGT